MKQKLSSNVLVPLKFCLIASSLLGCLAVVMVFQAVRSTSEAKAQGAGLVGSSITISTPLANAKAQEAVTSTLSISHSGVLSDSFFKTFGSATVFSSTHFFSKNVTPIDSGGGAYELPQGPELTDLQQQQIQAEIDKNIKRLGLTKPKGLTPFSTSLSWPIQAAANLTDYGYHAIGNFVDHDSAYPNHLLDYNCGNRTYDLASGYNHAGTDIITWPFSWNKMDNDEVEVVAAAPGTIVFKQDGNFDRSCSFNNDPWNAVFIQHADGSVAWYGHLKKNSQTSKPVGATVDRGEYLGIVGSSGSSTMPHLHFELYDSGNNLIDPYAGPCNNISSWWAGQRPYYDSAVNKLTTGSAAAVLPACPNPETSNIQNQFNPGDIVYFTTYYRDQLSSQQSHYTIYEPDGSVYQSWDHNSPASFYPASYWWWTFTLGTDVPAGVWKFEVVFNGQTYQHDFTIGSTVYLPLLLKAN